MHQVSQHRARWVAPPCERSLTSHHLSVTNPTIPSILENDLNEAALSPWCVLCDYQLELSPYSRDDHRYLFLCSFMSTTCSKVIKAIEQDTLFRNWTQHIIILISTAIKCSHSASDQTNCCNQTFHYISRAAIVGPLRHSIILCPPSALPLLKCDLANRAEHTILVLHMEFVCTVNHWPHIQTWSQGKYLSTQEDCKQVCGS